jgi:hypothetical protein
VGDLHSTLNPWWSLASNGAAFARNVKENESCAPAGTKRIAPGVMSGPPSCRIWKEAGAPVSCTLSVAVTWWRAQMVRPSPLTVRKAVLEVFCVVVVIVHCGQ